jgi:hypothetical protein
MTNPDGPIDEEEVGVSEDEVEPTTVTAPEGTHIPTPEGKGVATMTDGNVQATGDPSLDVGYPSGIPDDAVSQEEQARGLVEPSFEHRLYDEEALLAAEFGPADAEGVFARGSAAGEELDDTYASPGASGGSAES